MHMARAAIVSLSMWFGLALALNGAACGGGADPGDAAMHGDAGTCAPACSGATPYCDAATLHCVACRDDKDCSGPTICGTKDGRPACVQGCKSDSECVARGEGTTCCNRSCVDPQSDPANCGACGNACPVPANGSASCEAGQCGLDSCNAGYKDCDQDLSNGCEAHTSTDPQNCGACGNACPVPAQANAVCTDGVCGIGQCLLNYGDCDGNAQNGCETLLVNDPAHCGSCAQSCQAVAHGSAACNQGTCGVGICNTGFADCDGDAQNGCEAALQTDAQHCGACQDACSLPHTMAACNGGACVVGTCAPGWGNCDGINSNGCERSLSDDPQNCGGCGQSCGTPAHATAGCMDSACALVACTDGYADCDGNVANGCEVNRNTDPVNCGMCGHACPTPAHASATCNSGVCGIGPCAAGWADCNGNPSDGCETQTNGNDVNHCGSCGACGAVVSGSPACTAGTCTAACASGFADCDRIYGNGCETNLQASIANCGMCGMACSFANGAGACSGGACALMACNTNYASCDGDDANGCEVNLQTDKSHCGDCDTACASDHVCTGGVCKAASPITLASGQNAPFGIAVDDGFVYWTNYEGGTVMKVSKSGDGSPTTLASGQGHPHSIAVDADAIYWTNVSGGTVVKMDKSGGALIIASGQDSPYGIAVDGDAIYWVNAGGTVMKAGKADGVVTTLASGQGNPFGIALASNIVYWTNISDGTVMKVGKSGGMPIVFASGQNSPHGIVVDNNAVYWTNDVSDGEVMAAGLTSGAPVVLAADQNKPLGIAIDDSAVYWANFVSGGNVNRIRINEGDPIGLISDQDSPGGITADDIAIYWTTNGGGTVMKLVK